VKREKENLKNTSIVPGEQSAVTKKKPGEQATRNETRSSRFPSENQHGLSTGSSISNEQAIEEFRPTCLAEKELPEAGNPNNG
jgi:hypothetical protein